VNVVAVGIDPTEGPEQIRAYRERNGHPWTFAVGNAEFLEHYGMNATAAKVAVNREGIVVAVGGHTAENRETWERLLEDLAT
jgi:hypothetical protein